MPGRKYQASQRYRYGFNGKENDDETSTQDYGFRIYNPALGRFLSVDPLEFAYPELTPFQFGSNSPILNIDLDGLEGVPYSDPLQPIWEGFGEMAGAIAGWVDSWGIGNKEDIKFAQKVTKVSPGITRTESAYVTNTVKVSTNFKQNYDYIKYHNTNKGNPNPIVKVKDEYEVGEETETKVETNQGTTVTNTTRVNTSGDVSNEVKVEQKMKVKKLPIVVEGSTTNGTAKSSTKVAVGTAKVGPKDHNTQFKLSAETSTDKKANKTTWKAAVSNTTKNGGTTIKSELFIEKE